MKKIKHAVILDTNSFGDKNKYDFINGRIALCVNSFKTISNIDVFMPSIVYNELEKHIKESINASYNEIKSRYLKSIIDENDLNKAFSNMISSLDSLIEDKRITIIDCNKYADLKEVNEWYFNGEKPFEPSKPKEFPDAFIISASKNYFNDNKYDDVIAISNDSGFSEAVKIHTKFRTEKDIVNIMRELLNITDEEIFKCKKYIEDTAILSNIDTYKIESVDSNDYYDISDISYKVNDLEILEKNDNDFFVYVNCDLTLLGEFNIIDQDMSVYDNEDPECSVFFSSTGDCINVESFDVYITLNFDDKGYITDYEIEDVDSINLSDYSNQLELVN